MVKNVGKDKELEELEAKVKKLEDEKTLEAKKEKAVARIKELEREKSLVHKFFKFIKDH